MKGAFTKDLLFATAHHGGQRGCEVKWLIHKDGPRTQPNNLWASHLQSVQGTATGTELALGNGQNSWNSDTSSVAEGQEGVLPVRSDKQGCDSP